MSQHFDFSVQRHGLTQSGESGEVYRCQFDPDDSLGRLMDDASDHFFVAVDEHLFRFEGSSSMNVTPHTTLIWSQRTLSTLPTWDEKDIKDKSWPSITSSSSGEY